MRRRIIKFISLLFTCAMPIMSHGQSYDKLWKDVESAKVKDLPQTVIKLTDTIFRKAEKEKNSPQMLRAYVEWSAYRERIQPDSFYVDLKGLEEWATVASKVVDKAILHTLLACIYSDFASGNQWAILQRTDIADVPSDDIREWSGNIFAQKVIAHVQAALENPGILVAASTKAYVPFVAQGVDSRYYHHDMYHLLALKNLEALHHISWLKQDNIAHNLDVIYLNLEKIYREQNNKEALLLVILEKLSRQIETYAITSSAYLQQLDQLIAEYSGYDVCVEAYWHKVRQLMKEGKNSEAVGMCDEAIVKYPRYERIGLLKATKEELLSPYLTVQTDKVVFPEHEFMLHVTHCNLGGFTVNYYQVDLPVTSPKFQSQDINEEFCKKYATKKVRSQHIDLVRSGNCILSDTTLKLVSPSEGFYVMRIVPDDKRGNTEIASFFVTRLKMLSRKLPAGNYEIVLLDALSGYPVADAEVKILSENKGVRKDALSLVTGSDGRVEFLWQDDYRYAYAKKGKDSFFPPLSLYRGYYEFNKKMEASEGLKLLTDRTLYRPGQTVYVKGIAYHQMSDTANVVCDKNYTITLTDPNRREVGKKDVCTNEYGSFTAEFVLPSAGLNGMYMLSANNGSVGFRVEEYKRPTFDIIFDQQDGSYKLGDSVRVEGQVKTFSGIPVQDVSVHYQVNRTVQAWWRNLSGARTLMASGVVTLDDEGHFAIPVGLEPDKTEQSDREYYIYTVSATVTNVAGETQTSEMNIFVGSRSLLLNAQLPERLNKEDDIKAVFQATNLNGQSVSVKGTYMLYPFTDYPSRAIAKDPVCSGEFESNTITDLSAWKVLASGAYRLVLSAKDQQGRETTFETETVLFSIHDTRPAVETNMWYYAINTSFDASHPAAFLFGTSQKDAYVLMDVFCGNKRLESRSYFLSDSLIRLEYPYKEEYGDGLSISLCFVKNNQIYQQNVELKRRVADKDLRLSWSVFRDKLRPGQEEEWKLTVKDPSGLPVHAELLAVMYDASLDKIWKNSQSLKIYYPLSIPYASWMLYTHNTNYYYIRFKLATYKYPFSLRFDDFWMNVEPKLVSRVRFTPPRIYKDMVGAFSESDFEMKSSMIAGTLSAESAENNQSRSASAPLLEVTDLAETIDFDSGGLGQSQSVRTNFAETAFFYPQLRTNEQGEVVIAFTMPESLTRWNFNGYAHTKGMLTGMISAEAMTSKEFMLTPNLPRFVRVGDKTSVAASVINLTEEMVSGTVVFTLFDPLTEKVISTQKQKFAAETGKTVGVSFMFTPDDAYGLLGCRLVAEGGSFSDGEQHLLPVLSNKEMILETVAMPIRGNQTREFSLASLFNANSKTATNRRLTVEFTGNPVWYAVQALPSLSLPGGDNAISWAAAYYANSLASYMVNAQPRIKTIFDVWKLQGGTKDTFLSNLQKNQDVKNILLEESPWLMEATSEKEQMERIANLFDLNTIQINTITTLTKLKELQLADGSWSWYKGMSGSRYITNFVLQSLVRLSGLTGKSLDGDVAEMKRLAFEFLHQKALEEYKNRRKAEKTGGVVKGISGDALQYLYLIAISGEQVPEGNKAAYAYCMSKVNEGISSKSLVEKAYSAIILKKAGRIAEAQAYMASLKEYATQTDEQGMFFAFNKNPYTWGGLKIPVQVLVMEAFDLFGNDRTPVEEMKLWLLKQKQTQQWNSPVATVNAVYALLYRGVNLLESQGDARITLGSKVMETLSASGSSVPGIGYIRETLTDKKIIAKPIKAVVEKRDAGMAWGAVYAQFEEDIDQVTSYGEGLGVEKKLYVERVKDNKKELVPITSETMLSVGDKVVSRLTIRTDRAMDFVQLKDQRAACLEPLSSISCYYWNNGLGYYISVKDASTNFFFDALGKGVYILEYGSRVSRSGTYESGLAVIQSAYAPEYAAHSASMKLNIVH